MEKEQRTRKQSECKYEAISALGNMDNVNVPTQVELVQYNETIYLHKKLEEHADLKNLIEPGSINWFKITGFSDKNYIVDICKSFGLHNFDIHELLANEDVVKFVLYDNITFSLISGYYLDEKGAINNMRIAFILGDDFVLSFNESAKPVFEEIESAIKENDVLIRQKGTDFLLYTLLNSVNSFNSYLIIRTEDYLWDMEDKLIEQQESTEMLHALRNQRKNLMLFKRFISSLEEEYENLLNNSNKKVKAENMIYFENLDDKYRTTSDNIYNLEEAVKSLLDLYYNNNAMRMNVIMKRLTLVATIFIPLTFLVGVWGMNFHNMPELAWKHGYLASWILFAVIALVLILLMKKKKWF